MCGILGQIAIKGNLKFNKSKFIKCLSYLNHRGPDDEGYQVYPGAILGHKRLSILDNSKLDEFLDSSDGIFGDYNDIELIESIQRNDIDYYLLNDILTKVDRASMNNSLEVRSPLLNHKLVERAFKVPSMQKMRGNKQKIILKDILGKYLPDNLYDRPKMGFGIPIENWLKKDRMIKRCDDVFYNTDWHYLGYNKNRISKIWDDYKKYKSYPASKIWSYLISGLWANKNVAN